MKHVDGLRSKVNLFHCAAVRRGLECIRAAMLLIRIIIIITYQIYMSDYTYFYPAIGRSFRGGFLSFFLIRCGTRSLRMPALRPAS